MVKKKPSRPAPEGRLAFRCPPEYCAALERELVGRRKFDPFMNISDLLRLIVREHLEAAAARTREAE